MKKLIISDGIYEATLFDSPMYNESEDSDYLNTFTIIVREIKGDFECINSVRDCDISEFLAGYFPDFFNY